ncbi:MAG: RNA polymerase subunit sigma-24 [Planctomycetes bacterium]|jgi:RNA polymerase sigma-70 factor (ECF subfamily)|nr:RNA polymerase subunit sigma-24 [Planctomycetota bacterium]
MGDGRFLTTRWSVVLRAGKTDPQGQIQEQAREALERLAESYWFPLYAYVRRRGYDEEAARDLTQGFFVRLIERHDVSSASPERGRFRSFLLTALKNFLVNEEERERALKRGGGRSPVSFDAGEADRKMLEAVDGETPERTFERTWAQSVLERALERLRRDYDARQKKELFDALKDELGGGEGTPYAELAARLGFSEGAIKVAVHRMRSRYRGHLRQEVADTVAQAGDVEDELRRLFEALGA